MTDGPCIFLFLTYQKKSMEYMSCLDIIFGSKSKLIGKDNKMQLEISIYFIVKI